MANVKNKKDRRGITIIEMALVMLFLLTITFGVIEYGWFFYKSHQVANAARQAARVGARPSSDGALVISTAQAALTNAGIPLSVVTSIVASPQPESCAPGETFQVTVTIDYTALGLNMPMTPTPDQIVAEVTMAREGL